MMYWQQFPVPYNPFQLLTQWLLFSIHLQANVVDGKMVNKILATSMVLS